MEQLADVVEHANSRGLTTALHLRTRRPDFGREDAEIFIEHVLPGAPDVPIQIAHLAGWSGYDQATDAAFAALTELVEEPSLYFDISAVVKLGDRTNKQLLAGRLRRVDAARVLFGSDWPEWTPRAYAADILDSVPLNREELSTILSNCAPWIK